MFVHAGSEFADKGSSIHSITVAQKADLTTFIEKLTADFVSLERARILAPVIVMLLDGATRCADFWARKRCRGRVEYRQRLAGRGF